MIFEKFGKKRESAPPHQATPTDDSVSISRRNFLKKTGLFISGAVVGEHESEKFLKKIFKVPSAEVSPKEAVKIMPHKEKHVSAHSPEALSEPSPEVSTETSKESSPLDAYSFLDGQIHPVAIPTGELAGNTFSDLYAMYLGMPNGTVVPETLHVDFKENLATLWRKKFNLPARSHDERVEREQLQFLEEHHNLMNLAEYVYRSYDAKSPNTMTLEEYRNDVVGAVEKSRKVFVDTLPLVPTSASEDGVFSKDKISLISKMGESLTADTLMSLSFTELMPLDKGSANAQVFGFLLRNAGVDFIDRIPSVYDMLESFGPYQITPDALSPKSAGSWAAQVLSALPLGFMPWNVDELLRGKENIAAYTLAMLNIAQFIGTRNSAQLKCLSEVMHTLPSTQRAKAVLSFVAAAHHRPHEAYDAFDAFIWSMYVERAHSFREEDILRHIPTKDLREYTGKALANYRFLASGASVNNST